MSAKVQQIVGELRRLADWTTRLEQASNVGEQSFVLGIVYGRCQRINGLILEVVEELNAPSGGARTTESTES